MWWRWPYRLPPPRVASAAPRLPDLQRPVLQEAAPVVAPSQINPESLAPAPATPDLPMGDVSGSAPYLGTVVDNGVRVLTPPAVPRAGTPVRVSRSGPRADQRSSTFGPHIPRPPDRRRIQGTVILEAILDRDGRIDRLKVVRSVPLLDAAALEAVRRWRYTPTVLNGQPVAVLMTITIHFTLQ